MPESLWRPVPASFGARVCRAFYGGIVEETLIRWGVLTALIALLRRLGAHVLLGNGIAGAVFGWMFRRRGLEGAMVAHGAADVWLQAALLA